MSILHWKYGQMCQGEFGGAAWIHIRILHGSLYGSYMDPYVDLIWVVYMQMCSQLIQNVNISCEICANVSVGLRKSRGGAAGERGGAAGEQRGRFGGAAGEPQPGPPVDCSIGFL